MEPIRIIRALIAIFLFVFWILLSNQLTLEPSLTSTTIFLSLGMFAVVTIVIELVWRKDIEEKMKKLLDSEIREEKQYLACNANLHHASVSRDKSHNFLSFPNAYDFASFARISAMPRYTQSNQ